MELIDQVTINDLSKRDLLLIIKSLPFIILYIYYISIQKYAVYLCNSDNFKEK